MYERIAPEQYDSLDGVPEPSEVLQLFGHDAVVAHLTSAHRAAKLPHALVFGSKRPISSEFWNVTQTLCLLSTAASYGFIPADGTE